MANSLLEWLKIEFVAVACSRLIADFDNAPLCRFEAKGLVVELRMFDVRLIVSRAAGDCKDSFQSDLDCSLVSQQLRKIPFGAVDAEVVVDAVKVQRIMAVETVISLDAVVY